MQLPSPSLRTRLRRGLNLRPQLVQLWRPLTTLAISALALPAQAAIPPSERAVLDALYASTNGAGWTSNVGWGGAAGTECTGWSGVSCDAGHTHVTSIDLVNNNLVGTLPPIAGLTALEYFHVGFNNLTGSIPPLAGMTALQFFSAHDNQFTGSIPSLAGLTALTNFSVSGNQLTGTIPSLTGLSALAYFHAGHNQLTGSIPALTGLTALEWLLVSNNQLTGTIPSLAGLTALSNFYVDNNQLTGTPPAAPASLMVARLCPNLLSTPSASDAAWDTATGQTPWSSNCTPPPISYTITPSAGANGTISPATPQAALAGTTTTFTLAPAAGYTLDTVTGCGGTLSGTTYTTQAATADCTVSATFKADVPVVPAVPTPVPTLGQWGMLLLSLLAAGLGALRLRSRSDAI